MVCAVRGLGRASEWLDHGGETANGYDGMRAKCEPALLWAVEREAERLGAMSVRGDV